MVQAFDDSRSDDPRPASSSGDGSRRQSRSEESPLGAMLVSRDAIARMEIWQRRGLLQAVPRPHLQRRHLALFSQGEPADWVTVTESPSGDCSR